MNRTDKLAWLEKTRKVAVENGIIAKHYYRGYLVLAVGDEDGETQDTDTEIPVRTGQEGREDDRSREGA